MILYVELFRCLDNACVWFVLVIVNVWPEEKFRLSLSSNKSYHSGSVNLVCNGKINLWKTLFMFINLLFLT